MWWDIYIPTFPAWWMTHLPFDLKVGELTVTLRVDGDELPNCHTTSAGNETSHATGNGGLHCFALDDGVDSQHERGDGHQSVVGAQHQSPQPRCAVGEVRGLGGAVTGGGFRIHQHAFGKHHGYATWLSGNNNVGVRKHGFLILRVKIWGGSSLLWSPWGWHELRVLVRNWDSHFWRSSSSSSRPMHPP